MPSNKQNMENSTVLTSSLGGKKSELRANLQLSPKQGKTAKEGLVKTQRDTDFLIRKEMLVHIWEFYLW